LTTASIAVLTYQRRDVLRRALEAARAQRGPIVEILAVDNASTDGSAEMVRDEFPDVRLVSLPSNIAAAARNVGVAAAKGDVVVTVDNDVLFTSPGDVQRALDVLDRHPRAAAVDFMVVGPDGAICRRDWCHPRDVDRWGETEFLTDYVLEGASAWRREAFLDAGGYWPPFFIGHEGWDLALRVLARGRDLVYSPEIRVQHLVESSARPSSRIYYTFTRNAIWVALRNHRAAPATVVLAQSLAMMAFCALRAGHVGPWARGVIDGVRGARAALATRRALTSDAYARLRDLRRFRPSVAARIKRHVGERLI
jgi:GT2 family glycosyltransferase